MSMFSLKQFAQELPSLMASAMSHDKRRVIQRFDRTKDEETDEIYRGFKGDFESALEFWFWSLQMRSDWQSDLLSQQQLLESTRGWQFKWLSPEDFILLVRRHCPALRRLEKLPPEDTLIQAMQMNDEWDEVSAIAEFAAEYVVIHWSTSG